MAIIEIRAGVTKNGNLRRACMVTLRASVRVFEDTQGVGLSTVPREYIRQGHDIIAGEPLRVTPGEFKRLVKEYQF